MNERGRLASTHEVSKKLTLLPYASSLLPVSVANELFALFEDGIVLFDRPQVLLVPRFTRGY